MSQFPPSPEADFDLIERLCAGESDALAQAYDRYAPMVYRIGYHLLGAADDAEDLVQDVFTGLPRAARSFEGRSTFEHWLSRVATRTALMMLRQRRRERRDERMLGRLARQWSGADATAARMDLEAALRTVDEEFRIVFVLREVEGYSYEEIAELLGISAGTTRVRLHRARRRLRAYLETD